MGNLQCESKICCKGESSANEEIRLAAEAAHSFRPSLNSHFSETQLPQESLVESRLHSNSTRPAPTLTLKVVSSTCLPANSILRIMADGYEYSLRGAHDGVTYFGCKKRGKRKETIKGEIENDIVMAIADKEIAEKHRGRHFEITYRPDQQSYWIRDLGVGFGAFLRVDEKTRLRDNTLINIGESFIVVNLDSTERSKLKLKLFGGPCKGEVFYFSAEDFVESFIHIGRVATSEIVIEDSLISKCHASVFIEAGVWYLVDGDLDKGRSSTNGTWYVSCRLYLNDSCELREGMVFKANQTLFEVHFM